MKTVLRIAIRTQREDHAHRRTAVEKSGQEFCPLCQHLFRAENRLLEAAAGFFVTVGNDSALRTVAKDVGVVRAEGDDPELRLLHRRACCRFVEEEAARQRFAVCRGET